MDPRFRRIRVGAIEAYLDGTALRWVSLGGSEVLRGIDFSVRDSTWGTVRPNVESLQETFLPSVANVSIRVSYRAPAITINAVCSIVVRDTSVNYAAEFEASADSRINRIGLIVLHPLSVVGHRMTVERPAGDVAQVRFPTAIDPEVVTSDVVSLRWVPKQGIQARIEFDGDLWEMEDQRNWTDASFKSYPRSLREPFPFTLPAGRPGSNAVRLSLRGTPGRRMTAQTNLVEIQDRVIGHLASIGSEVRAIPIAPTAATVARVLELNHLRVACRPGEDAQAALGRVTEVATLGLPIEVDLIADPARPATIAEFADGLRAIRLVGVNVFSGRSDRALHGDATVIAQWVRSATSADLRVPVGAGTRANFAEINRTHPDRRASFVTYGINPQVHAFDDTSILETAATIPSIVRQASKIAGGRPQSVVVSGCPRLDCEDCPGDSDARMLQPLGAAWLVAVVAALRAPRVSRVTLLAMEELAAGIAVDGPATRVIAAVTELRRARVLAVSAPPGLAVLPIRHVGGYRIIIANLGESTRASIRLPCAGRWLMTSLVEATSRIHGPARSMTGKFALRLDMAEVVQLDLRLPH